MNPLFRAPEEEILFENITADFVRETPERVIRECRQIKETILASHAADKQQRLYLLDRLEATLDHVLSPLYLLKDVHPDDAIRNACHEAVESLLNFDNTLEVDQELFHALKGFADTSSDLSPVEARYLKLRMDNYLRNGLQLVGDERKKLIELDEKINQLELRFSKNIAEGEKTLRFTQEQLNGLPDDYLADRLQDDGTYLVTTQYPDYYPFMKFARDEQARRQLFDAFNSRAKNENLPVLRELLELRVQRAHLLGFKTYAEYQLGDKMAQNAEAVWSFISDVREKVREKANQDLERLCTSFKTDQLLPWDKSFATTQYKAKSFQLSEEEVKAYFPLDSVLEGLFDISQTLFSISFKTVKRSTWHSDVKTYEVYDGDKRIGCFYLDLFPRPKKYGHAACFGIQSGRLGTDGYVHPTAALVCNFPKPTATRPCLLNHGDVETMYHEFGHLLHQLLTQAPFYRLSGTSVARDFVEMPSQMMENWVWEKDVLSKYARHYRTGEPIPGELVDRMIAVRRLNSGMDVQQQLLYGALDLTYHDGYLPDDDQDTTKVYERLVKEYTLLPYAEGSCMQTSFGHLVGYSAGYYGYLWSKVYALDLYSVFEERGITNPEVGRRFRDLILATGDSEDPMVLLEKFLGRKPKIDAYLASIGV